MSQFLENQAKKRKYDLFWKKDGLGWRAKLIATVCHIQLFKGRAQGKKALQVQNKTLYTSRAIFLWYLFAGFT